jgi:hypothetical protein
VIVTGFPAALVEDDGSADTALLDMAELDGSVVLAADIVGTGDETPTAEFVAWRVVAPPTACLAVVAAESALDVRAVGVIVPHAARRPLATPATRRPDAWR